MSRRLRKDGEFTAEEERELFRTPPLTARKRRASTQSETGPETPTKRPTGRFNNGEESPFDTPTGPSNTTTMDPFQQQGESSRAQEPQEESRPQEGSRPKSPPPEMTPQQRYEFKMMELKVELMRLEAQKLAFAERGVSFQSTSNEPPAPVYRRDKVDTFHKYVASRAPKLTFKLEGQSNYNNWRDEALTQAHSIEAKAILKDRQRSPPTNLFNNDLEVWHLKNTAVYDMLMTGLKSDIRQNIKLRIDDDEKNAAELWIALEAEYRAHASDLRLELSNKLSSISMDTYGTDIRGYIADFRDILGKLKAMKYELSEWYVNDRFISGLRNWQSSFIQMKKDELRDQDKGKINEIDRDQIMDLLIARAINYENKNKDKDKKSNNALKAGASENKDESKSHNKSKDKDKSEAKPKKPNETSTPDNAEKKKPTYIDCDYCGRRHPQPCFYKHPESADEKWRKSNKAEIDRLKESKGKEIVPFNPNPSSGLSAQAQLILATPKKDPNWYLDSGASFHVSGEKDKFTDLRKVTESPATTPTGADLNTDSIETLRIQVDDQILTLHDSHYSPNTVTNLISFGMLERQGFEIEKTKRSDGLCLFRITDLEGQVFTANQSDTNIYPIQGKISNVLAEAKSKPKPKSKPNSEPTDSGNDNNDEVKKKRPIYETIQTWHRRLGHLNAGDIIRLSEDPRSGIKIKGSKFLPFCEACKLAGSKKKISRQPMRRSKRRGEFLHFDMVGGGKTLGDPDDFVPSFSGAKYFILITDDATRHRWMFFIQNKDDIYHVIVYFINHLINQGMTPSAFARSDWALEIDSKELQSFMSTKGCKWEPSAAYNQHQDGTSERAIQIILRRMRAVMIQAKLPPKLWAEIGQSVTYLTNISPTSTELYSELVENPITPYEAWHGVPYPHPKILRTIGTEAVVHKEGPELKKAGKLLEQGKKMILVGYRDRSTYRLYDRESDSVIVSESVDFNEDPLTENTENSEITDQSPTSETESSTEPSTKSSNEDNKIGRAHV